MAIGKNKRLGKKKGGKKKAADPFLSKEWYDIQAPVMFKRRNVGKSMVNPTRGQRIASDALRGRVFEVNLADLQGEEENSYRKMLLKCDEVHGRKLLTNFYGMDFTRDKLCSLIRKWHTLIEAFVDVKTTDGYVLRLFAIGFTKRRPNQVATTSYAQAAQVRAIRKRMVQTMVKAAETCDLKQLVEKFVAETISKDVQKTCSGIYPLENVFIRKVKTLKQPRFDLTKLMEVHEGTSADSGAVVTEVQVETLPGAGGRL